MIDDSGTLVGLLRARVDKTPDAVAFHAEASAGEWSAISWRDFQARVTALRSALQGAGLRHGDRVAIVASVSLQWEVLHHAALAAGAVVVGFDAHDLPQRIAAMAEQADVSVFAVTDPGVLTGVGDERLRGLRFLVDLRQPSDAAAVDWPAGVHRLRCADVGAAPGHAAVPEAAPGPTAADTATIIFTSGSSGAPKGIAYRHAQVCAAAVSICDAFDFVGPGSRLLCWLPLSNLFQRVVNLAAVQRGAATWLLSDPRRVMAAVAQVAPDIFIGVPRFYEKLHDGIRRNIAAQPGWRRRLAELAWQTGRRVGVLQLARQPVPRGLQMTHRALDAAVLARIRQRLMGDRLKCMVTGSAPMPVRLLEEFHALGWLVLEAYGLSENVVPMAMNRIDDFRFGTVGRPVAGNQIRIAEGGAIRVRGAGVFSGYLGDEAPPDVDADGFYATGDVGAFDADGRLRLIGRTNDLIKTSTGRRVAPVGVESRLCGVSGIDQVVLFGNGRKCLVALCTRADGGSDGPVRERLVSALQQQVAELAEHERPRGIGLLDRPLSIERGELTPNLKLKRAAIEALHAPLIESLYQAIDRQTQLQNQQLVVI